MVNNKLKLIINDKDFSNYVVYPIKTANLLDQRLDEAKISLRLVSTNMVAPLSTVYMEIDNIAQIAQNLPSYGQKKKRSWIVANVASAENPIGSGFYDLELNLIEPTKYLECIIVDTNTITNNLGREYTQGGKLVQVEYTNTDASFSYKVDNSPGYFSPINSKTDTLVVKPPYYNPKNYPNGVYGQKAEKKGKVTYSVTVQDLNFKELFKEICIVDTDLVPEKITYCERNGIKITDETQYNLGVTIDKLKNQIYNIIYTVKVGNKPEDTVSAIYRISAISNRLPLKNWTITSVINKLFDIAEPLRKGEKPRFRLNAEQAIKFNNILAPQLSFTDLTLRECLQLCGYTLQAEPRAEIVDGNIFEITYDEYGTTKKSNISKLPYTTISLSQNVENYSSCLDSKVQNLINQRGKNGIGLTEPYNLGFQTVRAETSYSRVTEDNMIIKTRYPIYTINKVICKLVGRDEDIDITDYVFESSIYDTQLSSYAGDYPYSKAYALRYTQGGNNITGLNFKQPNPISPVFSKYAIVNILRKATGNPSLEISNYSVLMFAIEYTPIYSARIGQTKVNFKEYPNKASIVYNQQANVIEAQNYGENLKGVIGRLGNVDKVYNYQLALLSDIPKVGDLFDDFYTISGVYTEIYPDYIKASVSLSKDDNRHSQFIGISSLKRMSEISQTDAVNRQTLWKEYIVIGDKEKRIANDLDCICSSNKDLGILSGIYTALTTGLSKVITTVFAHGESFIGDELPEVILPVISSAYGNSISFTWDYEDNYSAGQFVTYAKNNNISGYFQNDYPYTDYYGGIYYYHFSLQDEGQYSATDEGKIDIGLSLPSTVNQKFTRLSHFSTKDKPIILRKDNREKLQCNFQIDFVTNNPNLIIGSALTSYNKFVYSKKDYFSYKVYLYILDEPINKYAFHLTGKLNFNDWDNGYSITVGFENIENESSSNYRMYIDLPTKFFKKSGKAWAICNKQITKTQQVEDLEGNVTTESTQIFGDVLLAQNIEIIQDKTEFKRIYFTVKKDIFKGV